MASWTSLAVLSALAVSTLSLPERDGAYNIPSVGTGRRSQYFVLHSDGTYKYGHDTGEGAFESARLKSPGDLEGEFGYKDPDGNDVNLQYKSGDGGFVAKGNHLPVSHPDFDAAHAAARGRAPFVDPLADSGIDASYNFQFAGEEHSRREESDSDGNVRGSYTYTDEEGITRTYSYTAGRDTGFVIEGTDLPQGPVESGLTPAATRFSSSGNRVESTRISPSSQTGGTTDFANRRSTTASFRPTARLPSRPAGAATRSGFSRSASFHRRGTSSDGSHSFSNSAGDHSRLGSVRAAPASGFGNRINTSNRQSTYHASSASQSQPVRPHSALQTSRLQSVFQTSRPQSAFQASSRIPFEEANTRSELRPDGSYVFAYETSSHSRAETGDSDNNVDGKFDFAADDDGQRREIKYEAGTDTGFIAEGDHIPVGPEVPGAPSGQPTGRIVPVQEVPFVDPLADTGSDASYNFAFDSEQYSRSEVADSEGNVQGTYTVADDDGTRRTYRFRAGKGVGFETEEVSVSRGSPPTRQVASAFGSSTNSVRGANTVGSTAGFRGESSPTSTSSGSSAFQSIRPSTSAAFRGSGSFSSTSVHGSGTQASPSTINRGGSGLRTSSYTAPASLSHRHTSTSSLSSLSSTPLRSSFTPVSTKEVFPGFQLHQYDASKNPDKFGYVLTFDN